MIIELTIGRLADAAGVNVETIRYYQRRGLMAEPDKPAGGHRRYASDAVRRVRFIKRAQVLGFTLDEVGSLLQLDAAHACAETRELAAHKLQVIEAKLADLEAMRKALTALLRQCDAGASKGNCPIIHALAADGSTVKRGQRSPTFESPPPSTDRGRQISKRQVNRGSKSDPHGGDRREKPAHASSPTRRAQAKQTG